jgi:predicted dehydrogenase
VGLVGAGPWAEMVHAPVFAAGPETSLVGIWARRADAAATLAARYGSEPVDRVEDLFERCEAVVFSVPPAVQAPLAIDAARHGRALVLEKPIAADLETAERLAEAVDDSGVPSMVVLTWRYAAAVRAFLAAAASFDAYGGRGEFLAGGLLDGPFRTPWRLEAGPLLDLGPHVIDLLDAALGPVVEVDAAAARAGRWVTLQLGHQDGAISQAVLCSHTPLDPRRAGAQLYGPEGVLEVDCVQAVDPEAFATMRAELATLVRDGGSHPLAAGRGLHLQRIIDRAERCLAS